MRTSRTVATLLLTSALSAPFLAACDSGSSSGQTAAAPAATPEATEPSGKLFTDFNACVRENGPEVCSRAEADARDKHEQTAPRFMTKEACEQNFGPEACVERPNVVTANGQTQQAGSVFMPVLAGFLIGNALSNALRPATPVYVDRQGFAYAGGRPWGSFDDNWRRERERERERSGGYGGFTYYGSSSHGASGWSSTPRSFGDGPSTRPTTGTPSVSTRPGTSAPTVGTPTTSRPSPSVTSTTTRGGFGGVGASSASAGS